MNHNGREKLSNSILKKLEKYIKAFYETIPQVIVQSRCGERQPAHVKTFASDVFEIAIENNSDIHAKAALASENFDPLKPFSLCVEILLKTSDGDTLVLEVWRLQLLFSEQYWQQNNIPFTDAETIFGHFMILLKSTITVSRIIPAYKLSLRQSADSYVMLYKIYPGDPQVDNLGTSPQDNKIGEVHTPVGTINLSVIYRSKHEMSIAPQRADKENFMVKSDYFNVDFSPKFTGMQLGKRLKHSSQNSSIQNVGAFAPRSNLPDPIFPELAFLEKPFLNLSRSPFNRCEKKQMDNISMQTDSNLNFIDDSNQVKVEDDPDKLTCSDTSDGSDFVLVDLKPSFAQHDSDNDIGAFFQECQSAPPLPSLSGQVTLKDQVHEVTNQLAQFELSMSGFDSFVDSVCQVDNLGTSPQDIGEVHTLLGAINLSVSYRSEHEMSIAPQRADKENFMVKSDYFNVDLSPKFTGMQLGKRLKHSSQNSSIQNVGAFASRSNLPDPIFPELAFLEKPFLNLSRSPFNRCEKKETDNISMQTDSNLNFIDDLNQVKVEDDPDELTCSDTSDGSDFVLVDLISN